MNNDSEDPRSLAVVAGDSIIYYIATRRPIREYLNGYLVCGAESCPVHQSSVSIGRQILEFFNEFIKVFQGLFVVGLRHIHYCVVRHGIGGVKGQFVKRDA